MGVGKTAVKYVSIRKPWCIVPGTLELQRDLEHTSFVRRNGGVVEIEGAPFLSESEPLVIARHNGTTTVYGTLSWALPEKLQKRLSKGNQIDVYSIPVDPLNPTHKEKVMGILRERGHKGEIKFQWLK